MSGVVRSMLGVILVALLASSVTGAAGDQITMTMSQYRNVNLVRVLVFSGTVASGAAGEAVDVVGQFCGERGYHLIGATQTRPGGGWEVQNPSSEPPYASASYGSGTTFRARRREHLSNAVVFRIPAVISAAKVPGRPAWKVHVFLQPPGIVYLTGKGVELQRRVGTRWVRYRRARLVRKASYDLGPYNHEALFSVPTRGLRLRAFLPRKSALPCYLPAATPSWRS